MQQKVEDELLDRKEVQEPIDWLVSFRATENLERGLIALDSLYAGVLKRARELYRDLKTEHYKRGFSIGLNDLLAEFEAREASERQRKRDEERAEGEAALKAELEERAKILDEKTSALEATKSELAAKEAACDAAQKLAAVNDRKATISVASQIERRLGWMEAVARGEEPPAEATGYFKRLYSTATGVPSSVSNTNDGIEEEGLGERMLVRFDRVLSGFPDNNSTKSGYAQVWKTRHGVAFKTSAEFNRSERGADPS